MHKSYPLTLIVTTLLASAPIKTFPETPKKPAEKNISAEEAKTGLNSPFLKFYRPVTIDIKPAAPKYKLPIIPDEALKYKKVFPEIENKNTQEHLSLYGFVVTIPKENYTQFFNVYELLKSNNIPVFLTSDTVLHLYHILFDSLLKDMEEKNLKAELTSLTTSMVSIFDSKYTTDIKRAGPISKLTSAYRRNVGYFSVAAKLLDDSFSIPDYVEKEVIEEIKLIEQHSGFKESPLFIYKEDYSQYVPSGHYTQTAELRQYFKAMIWYGRMVFLLKGKTPAALSAIIDENTAKLQTTQAMLITSEITNNKSLYEKWRRLYEVTAFFSGFSDDLTIDDYQSAFDNLPIAGATKDLYSDKMTEEMRKALAVRRTPAIYGGTGNIVVETPVTEKDLDKILASTAGLRLFGQRSAHDSYIMGRLVGMAYVGKNQPFTKTDTQIGPIRGFPRGLDIMAVMGSDRAAKILKQSGDTEYAKYDDIEAELRMEMHDLNEDQWHSSLYWGWLSSLKPLIQPIPPEYPTFMTTEAWADRQLEEALASWSQLRHDTILYAKQSYEAPVEEGMEEEKVLSGYIEPAIELYAQLRTLNVMMLEGSDSFGLLDKEWLDRLERVNSILNALIEISKKELTGVSLDKKDVQFISDFTELFGGVLHELSPEDCSTAIIADVYTDPNTANVLEVGTGTLNIIWVACPKDKGSYFISAGPVLSFHEFKQPMSNRLTDEHWRKLVQENKEPELDIFKKP